jgi:hypothetical protein
LLTIGGSALAVIARLPTAYGTPTIGRSGAILSRRGAILSRLGAILSRLGAVSGGTLTVPGRALGDLPACVIHPGAVLGKLTVTFHPDLIALVRRFVPSESTHVTPHSRAGTPHDALATFVRVALACVAHPVMQITLAARHEIAVARSLVHVGGSLIFIGRSLVGIGRGLLGVAPRLFGIRESLLSIGSLLILSQPSHCGRVALLWLGACACRVRMTLVRRLDGHIGLLNGLKLREARFT